MGFQTAKSLSGRETERLFKDWGFIPDPHPSSAAGGHKWFRWRGADGPRVAITAPGRKRDSSPLAAFKKAAGIVGVPLDDFMAGRDVYLKKVGLERRVVSEIEIPSVSMELAMVGERERQGLEGALNVYRTPLERGEDAYPYIPEPEPEPESTIPEPPIEEPTMPTTPTMPITTDIPPHPAPMVEEQILHAIEQAGHPLTVPEIAIAIGRSPKVNQTFREMLKRMDSEGLLHSRLAERGEAGSNRGVQPVLYHYDFPVPGAKVAAEVAPAPIPFLPTTAPAPFACRLCTFLLLRTKGDGSLVLLDDGGDLFVAQRVEV